MNFQEQLKYDKLQKIQKRLQLWTKTIIQTTQADVTSVMDVKTESKEIAPEIVELDSENYGAPPENSGIMVYRYGMEFGKWRGDPQAEEPRAYEDQNWNWFYNRAGAVQLANMIGRTLPDGSQLRRSINADPSRFRPDINTRSDVFMSSWYSEGRTEGVYLKAWTVCAIYAPFLDCVPQSVRFIIDKK